VQGNVEKKTKGTPEAESFVSATKLTNSFAEKEFHSRKEFQSGTPATFYQAVRTPSRQTELLSSMSPSPRPPKLITNLQG